MSIFVRSYVSLIIIYVYIFSHLYTNQMSKSRITLKKSYPIHNQVTPVWGDFLFSVRFRRVCHVRRVCVHVRRRNVTALT